MSLLSVTGAWPKMKCPYYRLLVYDLRWNVPTIGYWCMTWDEMSLQSVTGVWPEMKCPYYWLLVYDLRWNVPTTRYWCMTWDEMYNVPTTGTGLFDILYTLHGSDVWPVSAGRWWTLPSPRWRGCSSLPGHVSPSHPGWSVPSTPRFAGTLGPAPLSGFSGRNKKHEFYWHRQINITIPLIILCLIALLFFIFVYIIHYVGVVFYNYVWNSIA